MTERESPFSPGKPVQADLFVGREDEIGEVIQFLRQCATGRNENIAISGERGFGKSSLALMAASFASRDLRFGVAYCQLTAASTTEEVCTLVAERLLAQLATDTMAQKAKTVFNRYIDHVSVGLFGTGLQVKFRPDPSLRIDLKLRFPELITETYLRLAPEIDGLMIVLDDLNGVVRDQTFANFLKGWVDGMVTSGHRAIPLAIVVVASEDKLGALTKSQPSVGRIFRPVVLHRLPKDKTESFFTKAFASANVSVEKRALRDLCYFSDGVPSIMHEVGDAAFWQNQDQSVSSEDAQVGIIKAAKIIGLKYVEPQVVSKIRSKSYRQIISAMAALPGRVFTRKQLLSSVPGDDKKQVDNLLVKLKALGVIHTTEETPGEYEFIHTLDRLYFRVISAEWKAPKTR
ncbi:MAG: ATP-binding protein [candidate division Zixibacteria bacterium]|nr:ATP-binding protein [candidate division Zixibacteria bacterium]